MTDSSVGALDGLLTTKLYPPRLPRGFVRRPRLVGHLDDGLKHKLTLVCAPAGSGKTSLLADAGQVRPVAWLSLDVGDSDPARFWRYTAAALDRVRPGVAQRVVALLEPPSPPSFEGVVAEIVNHLATEPGQVLLVLDDYHLIESEPVHASLLYLIEHAPPGLHVAVASRADPQLALARLRVRGQLAELRAAELRFTASEASAMLSQEIGSDLDDDTVAALVTRTEGWAAGLQLAGLSLRDEPNVAQFVRSFSGSHRYVLDYLTEEVLEHQPEVIRRFLLETSVLSRLCGPLCEAVTGRADAQQLLEMVEAANLFVIPLDDVRGWWRYHHLFAELLQGRLRQLHSERIPDLHRAAAAWHEENGPVDSAVRHALAAGESTWAARMIERHFDEFYLSEGVAVQRWLSALPHGLASSRPRLRLVQAALSLVAGQVDEVEDALDAAERAFSESADETFEPSVGKAASRLANVHAAIAVGRSYMAHRRGDGETGITHASRALAVLDESEWMLNGLAHASLSVAAWVQGDMSEAQSGFGATIAKWRAVGDAEQIAIASSNLGRVQCAQGRLNDALRTYREGMATPVAAGMPPPPAAGVAYVGMAEVFYRRDDLDAALSHAVEGVALCQQFLEVEFLTRGLATLAWIRQAEGDATAARDAMEEAERRADPSVTDLLNPVPAQRAQLMLAQGDVDATARWITERKLSVQDDPDYSREPAYLVLARMLLVRGEPEKARRLLDRLNALAVAQGRVGSVIEIQALRSLTLSADGREVDAVAALAEALTLAHQQGYIRVFVDEGPPMGALLGRLIADRRERPNTGGAPLGYLARLVRAFERCKPESVISATTTTAAAGPQLVVRLSDRELEVLRMAAVGASNQEIAAALYVAVSTVKKHVTHILDKLGAANRTEATALARELGLLS